LTFAGADAFLPRFAGDDFLFFMLIDSSTQPVG